jgi:hypothetical protein
MGQLYMERQAEVSAPRDQVWEYMSDLRRALTLDQFHISVECTATDATNPKPGLIIPIAHRILGRDQLRMGRITRFNDYELSWGESTPRGEFDSFPHSEGWRIEEINSKSCLVTLWMKGQWRTPVGMKIEKYIWDSVIAPNLDRDIADLAQEVGAEISRPVDPLPDEVKHLMALSFAQTINGIPAQEFFDGVPPLYPDKEKPATPQAV